MAVIVNSIVSKATDIVFLFIRQLQPLISSSSNGRNSEPYNEVIQKILAYGQDQMMLAATSRLTEVKSLILGIIRKNEKLGPMVLIVAAKAPNYDLDVPVNGYRTFVKIAEKVARITHQLLQNRCTNVSRWRQLSDIHFTLVQLFDHLIQMMSQNPDGELLTREHFSVSELLRITKGMRFECFFGNFLGLQFDELLSWQLKWVFNWFSREINEVKRAQRLVKMFWHADIYSIRSIWNSSDSGILWLLCRLMRPMAYSSHYESHEDKKINGRLISSVLRRGIMSGREPLAPGIIIHVHGGGFISNTAKAAEIYLRDWANHLKVPVFSVNYSLSPEHRHPTAMHEVVAAYEHIRQNPTLFGTTGRKIVMTGESAGASLILGAMFVCIEKKIPLPDGIFLVNVPVQIELHMSPSRLLCNMDPLLPLGFMLRCAAAHCGNETEDSESSSCIICEDPEDPVHKEFENDARLRLFDIPDNHYYNCLTAPTDLLKKLPPTFLCSSTADPVLDDMIMFGKILRSLGNQVSLKVFQDLPHGFLNFSLVHGAASKASLECAKDIGNMLAL